MTRPTRRAAELAAADLAADVRDGSYVDPAGGLLTVDAWYEQWREARVAEQSTRAVSDVNWRAHVKPAWEHRPLGAITTMAVQGWVRRMEVDGVGPNAITKSYYLLRSLLETAAVDRKIPRNPALGVRLPTIPKASKRILAADEEARLLADLAEPYRTLVIVTLDCGLRWAEVAGLHVDQLDMLRKRLTVSRTLRRDGTVKPYPKSAAGFRTVPLSERAALALARHLEGHPGGLVFTGQRGGPLNYGHVRSRVWATAVEKAKIAEPLPTMHDLRHTYATRLLEGGAHVEEVRAMLGHEKLTTTQLYVQSTPDAEKRVRGIIDGGVAKRDRKAR